MEKAIEIKEYWDERAIKNATDPKATTDDVYLRDLEIKTFISTIQGLGIKKGNILDVGCGDGYTTLKVASELKKFKITGVDYSEGMIANAINRLDLLPSNDKKRIQFRQ